MSAFRAVILGAPGSGKGTISSRIVRKFDMKHIASGDILRNNVVSRTDLGLEAQKYMDGGRLVPDDLMIKVIVEEIKKHGSSNWLLDGFPRTRSQVESLHKQIPVNVALNLIVPFDIIVDRIQKRWIHLSSGRVYNTDFNAPKVPGRDDITGEELIQREDDKPASIQNRLEIYSKTIGPVLDFYREQSILKDFKGNTSNEIWPLVYNYLSKHITPNGDLTIK